MRWFHILDGDEVLVPRTGFYVRRHYFLYNAELNYRTYGVVLAVKWPFKRWFLQDFDQSVVYAKPKYWVHVSFIPRSNRAKWEFAKGIMPHYTDLGEGKARNITIYRSAK